MFAFQINGARFQLHSVIIIKIGGGEEEMCVRTNHIGAHDLFFK